MNRIPVLSAALAGLALAGSSTQAGQDECWLIDRNFDKKAVEAEMEANEELYRPALRYQEFVASGELSERLKHDATPEARFLSIALTLHEAERACGDDRTCSRGIIPGPLGESALQQLAELAADYPARLDFAMAAHRLCHAVRRDEPSFCFATYAEHLADRFPGNAATAFVSAAAAIDRGDEARTEERLGLLAAADHFDNGGYAINQITVELLDQHLPPATAGELPALRPLMVYSIKPGDSHFSNEFFMPGENEVFNHCGAPADAEATKTCLGVARALTLPGAREQYELQSQIIEVKIADGTGTEPNENVHKLVRNYRGGPPQLKWNNVDAMLRYQMDIHELGHRGATVRYLELGDTCGAN